MGLTETHHLAVFTDLNLSGENVNRSGKLWWSAGYAACNLKEGDGCYKAIFALYSDMLVGKVREFTASVQPSAIFMASYGVAAALRHIPSTFLFFDALNRYLC
jgi:hypothetical protein